MIAAGMVDDSSTRGRLRARYGPLTVSGKSSAKITATLIYEFASISVSSLQHRYTAPHMPRPVPSSQIREISLAKIAPPPGSYQICLSRCRNRSRGAVVEHRRSFLDRDGGRQRRHSHAEPLSFPYWRIEPGDLPSQRLL